MAKTIEFTNEELDYMRVFMSEYEAAHREDKDFGVFLSVMDKIDNAWLLI